MGRLLPEHTTAVSLLDRLLQHNNVVATDGESYRMREARTEQEDAHEDLTHNATVGTFNGH